MDHNKKTILIVDDDHRNTFALSLVLRSKGYTCLTAPDAASGFQLLHNQPQIGILLLDMMMPEMDGYEAIAHIRKDATLQQLPVVAVTAQAMPGDREKCLAAGADAYLSKPVNVDALLEILATYL